MEIIRITVSLFVYIKSLLQAPPNGRYYRRLRIISIVVATLLFCYIVFVSFFFREIRQDSICQDLQVVVKDSLDKHFVSESDLVSILKKAGLDPIKRSMADVNTDRIETELQIES